MFINSAISYLGAWEDINNKYQREYQDIKRSVESIGNIQKTEKNGEYNSNLVKSGEYLRKLTDSFELSLEEQGWFTNRKAHFTIKNMVGVDFMFSRETYIDNWLFRRSVLAVKGNVCELPILILPMKELIYTMKQLGHSMSLIGDFERALTNLNLLSPLYLNTPFLILGISEQEAPLEFYEIPSNLEGYNQNVVINRSIEFPPEYYQAGIGILSYFHKLLHEKYPDIQATVKIIQDGLVVKMVVETEDGNREIIEETLENYGLIIKGDIKPEEYYDASTQSIQILDLRNELRTFAARVESQKELIALQQIQLRDKQNQIEVKDVQINTLMEIVSKGLSKPTVIENHLSPVININQQNNIHNEISKTIDTIRDLKSILTSPDDCKLLKEVEKALSETDESNLKNSGGISKLKGFLDTVNNTESTISKAINSTNNGIQLVKNLGKHYNTIASLCGLPEIPFI